MAGQDQTQVVAGRNMVVYTAPWHANNVIPADTVNWGVAWGSPGAPAMPLPWVDKGFTRDGLRFRLQVTRTNVNVDQVVDPVLRLPTARDIALETRLAQVNASNLADASGQASTTTLAAISGTRGHDDMDINGVIVDQWLSAGYDVQNPGDLQAIRMVGYKGIILAQIELAFNATDAAQIQFNLGLVPDTSSVPSRVAKFRDIIAALP